MNAQPNDSPELNSYFRQLAELNKPVVSSSSLPAELRNACGPWVSVTATAAKAAFALRNVKTAGPIIELVLALSGVNDAQTELLKSIKADTILLRQEPLQTAVTLMAEANRVGPSDERWTKFLDQAIENLYRAKGLAGALEEQAVVQFGLACAYLTLDKPADARYWIEESARSERLVLDALLKNCRGTVIRGNVEKGDHGLTLKEAFQITLISIPLGGSIVGNLGQTYKDAIKSQVMQKRIEALRQFAAFANAVEICTAAISGRTETAILKLEKSGVSYFLSETTLTMPPQRSLDA